MDFLEKIIEQKKIEVKALYHDFGIDYFQKKIVNCGLKSFSFFDAFSKNPGLKLIAEIKKASPSKGIIREDFEPLAVAMEFTKATALSVLTEKRFFLGHPDFITLIKSQINLPILRKDFIIDPIQIYEAKAIGADAILLIKAILDNETCQKLIDVALSLNLEVLLEIHSLKEFEEIKIIKGLNFIGINNRDLKTFEINKSLALDLLTVVKHYYHQEIFVIAESGYSSKRDLDMLSAGNVDGVLIGEGLAKQPELLDWFKSYQ
ncbi:MAG: indole-3-glycerol phosphate synthase TrpC [Candidatus Margulisiibacteriota bacterium]|jgi:indole-3-glycerol phosphate synthase